MRLVSKSIYRFMYMIQIIGAVFVGIFLSAYMGGLAVAALQGLELTTVLHSEAPFRIPLVIFGAALLLFVVSSFVLSKKD